jgi:hypothetical protein
MRALRVSVDKWLLYGIVTRMRFACQLSERGGTWTAVYTGNDIGPIRVVAPAREEALRKLEGEIRYHLEMCPCTGETYRDIEIEVAPMV